MTATEQEPWYKAAVKAEEEHRKLYPGYDYSIYRGTAKMGDQAQHEIERRMAKAAEAARKGKTKRSSRRRRSRAKVTASTPPSSLGSSTRTCSVDDTSSITDATDTIEQLFTAPSRPFFGQYDPFDQRSAEARYFRGDPIMVDNDEEPVPSPIGFPYFGQRLMRFTGCPPCDLVGYEEVDNIHTCMNFGYGEPMGSGFQPWFIDRTNDIHEENPFETMVNSEWH
jgi:hypothetical protein